MFAMENQLETVLSTGEKKIAPLVSVIVPVCNVGLYLCECLESLVGQTYPNYEVIIVDDESTDDTAAIAHQFMARNNRFRVYSQKKQGVSAARNLGMEKAKGTYLQFADGDDTVHPDFIRKMVAAIERNHADLAGCRFEQRDKGGCIPHVEIPIGIYDGAQYLKCIQKNPVNHTVGVLWNKIYRRDLVCANQLRFDSSISLGEDFAFNMNYLAHCRQIVWIDDVLYYYTWKRIGALDCQTASVEQLVDTRKRLYKAYQLPYASFGLEQKKRFWLQFYPVKCYFDYLEEHPSLPSEEKAALFRGYILENGIGKMTFMKYAWLKRVRRLLRRQR